jgi:hypothetical protein
MRGPRPVLDISVTIDGVEHHGTWFVQDGSIYVRSPLGSKTTWVHESTNAESLAGLLLVEMASGVWP